MTVLGKMTAASLVALAQADAQFFAPAYGQMQAVAAAYAPLPNEHIGELAYVEPVAYSAEQPDDASPLVYLAGAAVVGAAAAYAARAQKASAVAEPDLESATGAAKVAMLFSSGRSSGKKAPARGKKAPAKKSGGGGGFFGGGAKKAPARAAPVDDGDLFVHDGTNGFQ